MVFYFLFLNLKVLSKKTDENVVTDAEHRKEKIVDNSQTIKKPEVSFDVKVDEEPVIVNNINSHLETAKNYNTFTKVNFENFEN